MEVMSSEAQGQRGAAISPGSHSRRDAQLESELRTRVLIPPLTS